MMHDLISIAHEAGEAILSYYHEPIAVHEKKNSSPLTRADLTSHQIISQRLRQLGDIPVISEEDAMPDYGERISWERYWLVDPLDGTKEFIKRNGEFTVNIALIEHDEPVLGVVYLPGKKLTYIGEKNQGSYKVDVNGSKTRIISREPDIKKPLIIAVSRSHASENLDQKLAEHNIIVKEKITAGSSLKFCLVAERSADIYPRFGPTMEWDTAAGDAVFRYSGLKKDRRSPLTYNKPTLKNDEFIIGL